MARGQERQTDNGLGREIERKLWAAADKLRGSMDAAEYKHVVLGLIFLKYISDAFEARRDVLLGERDQGADPEDPDEYRSENVFWVPAEARWSHLLARAKQLSIGSDVDKAMDAIERENPKLKGVLLKDYNRPGLDKTRLGGLIDQIGSIALATQRSERATYWGRFTSTSSRNSPRPRASEAGSSTRRGRWSSCWWRCSPPTRAGCLTRAAARAACFCRASDSSWSTRGGSATSASSARRASARRGTLR